MAKNTTGAARRERGFTILESLVAIAILLVALTGPMVFAQQSLRAARLSGDQITAFYLAQDAIELVKHVRDENSLYRYRDEWLYGLEECFAAEQGSDGGCQVSVSEWEPGADTAGAVDSCTTTNCRLYEQENLFGLFGQDPRASGDAPSASRFSRRVKIMTPEGAPMVMEDGDEALVEVEVWWDTLGISGTRRVLVREHVYNWIQ